MKRLLFNKWLWGGLGIAGLAVAIVFFSGKQSGGELRRDIASAERKDLLIKVTVAGTVIPHKRTVFTPAYSGYVRKLYVSVGDKVVTGAPVVSLAQSPNGGDVGFPMRAPFGGSVVQVLKSEGEYVEEKGEGNAIVRIDDLSRLFVVSEVPENDIGRIRLGQEVMIKVNAVLDRSYKGVIREIALAAKEKKEWRRSGDGVEFEVRIEITDQDAQVKPGMSSIVDIITDKRERVLALQQEFVEKNGNAYQVTLADGKKREVQVGVQNAELFEIRGGLQEGEKVKMVDFLAIPSVK